MTFKHHWAYLKYVLKHKYHVYKAGRRLKVSRWQLLVHDWTKFLPGEWSAYVAYFFARKDEMLRGRLDPGKVDEAFDVAWLNHQRRNKHHWNYWVLSTERPDVGRALPMPEKYVREMIADWMGASAAKTGSPDITHWVLLNAARLNINPRTADLLHDILVLELGLVEAGGAVYDAHCSTAIVPYGETKGDGKCQKPCRACRKTS